MYSTTVFLPTPLGLLQVSGTAAGVTEILFLDNTTPSVTSPPLTEAPVHEAIRMAEVQLGEYFAGQRKEFDFPMQPQGTDFQQHIWRLLLDIPFGATCSYLELARRYGDEKAIRAVAAANGHNPLAIVVPCHRVIGSDGKLVGYAGGLWRKKWLLQHERQHSPTPPDRLF